MVWASGTLLETSSQLSHSTSPAAAPTRSAGTSATPGPDPTGSLRLRRSPRQCFDQRSNGFGSSGGRGADLRPIEMNLVFPLMGFSGWIVWNRNEMLFVTPALCPFGTHKFAEDEFERYVRCSGQFGTLTGANDNTLPYGSGIRSREVTSKQ